ncbi:MAG: transcriptional regulator [Conexibacter sp.]|nr:transcriptional regulator [Conexibacter sp.]
MARLHRDATHILIADIVTGTYEAGSRLPRELDLAAEFGISRGVARECIRALEERGLINVRHGRGATVNPPERWDLLDPDTLAATLSTRRASMVIQQYLECRRILEVQGAELAARRASNAEIAALAERLAALEATTRHAQSRNAADLYQQAEFDFHIALVAGSENHALVSLVERINSALLTARETAAPVRYRRTRAFAEHQRIYDAIAAHRPRAARDAVNAHLDSVAGYLLTR